MSAMHWRLSNILWQYSIIVHHFKKQAGKHELHIEVDITLLIEHIRYAPTGPHFNFSFGLPDIFFIVLVMNGCGYVKND